MQPNIQRHRSVDRTSSVDIESGASARVFANSGTGSHVKNPNLTASALAPVRLDRVPSRRGRVGMSDTRARDATTPRRDGARDEEYSSAPNLASTPDASSPHARAVSSSPHRAAKIRRACIAHRAIARSLASNETYLLPCGRQTIMDLALDTLPVETATVLATCAEAWVIADMIVRED